MSDSTGRAFVFAIITASIMFTHQQDRYSLTMSNLVPEPRADKNGKIVTRHVKVEAPGGHSINIPIPAPRPTPTASAENAKENLCADLSYAIHEETVDYSDSHYDDGESDPAREGIYEHLKTFPLELLQTLDSMQREDELLFEDLTRRIEQRESPLFISNFIKYNDVIGGDVEGDEKTAFVRSLEYYPQLEKLDVSTDEATSKIRALLTVERVLFDQEEKGTPGAEEAITWQPHDYDFVAAPVIKDHALVDFILENHERAEKIRDTMELSKAFTLDRIKMIMDHPEKAIAEGLL